MNTKNFIFYIFSLICIIFFIFINFFSFSSAAALPSFKNCPKSLTVGTTYKYTVTNIKKNHSISYNTNNSRIASINKKTGLLTAHKKGNVKVTALIKYQSGLSQKKITDNLIITTATNTDISYKILSVSKYINSSIFTIEIYFKNTINKNFAEATSLTLLRDNITLHAKYKYICNDNKTIIYELDTSSIKKLSPGDGSMDGNYVLLPSFTTIPYSILYKENIIGKSICGFVYNKSGIPLSNVHILIFNDYFTEDAISDENGYFFIKFPILCTVNLYAYKDGLYSSLPQSIKLKNIECVNQNIFLPLEPQFF